jgi:hypothetical protein
MSFWRRRHKHKDASERAIDERREQKKRGAQADEEYYRAMRRFAIDAGDADSLRLFDSKLRDLETLQYELEVLTNEDSENFGGRR